MRLAELDNPYVSRQGPSSSKRYRLRPASSNDGQLRIALPKARSPSNGFGWFDAPCVAASLAVRSFPPSEQALALGRTLDGSRWPRH